MTWGQILDIPNTGSQDGYKYYQLEAIIIPGLAGKIEFNGKKISKFENGGSRLSSNKIQDYIKPGNNTLTLIINEQSDSLKLGYFDEADILIVIHGVNEKIFPSKETRIVTLKWNSKDYSNENIFEYQVAVFPYKGDQ